MIDKLRGVMCHKLYIFTFLSFTRIQVWRHVHETLNSTNVACLNGKKCFEISVMKNNSPFATNIFLVDEK